MGRFNDILNRVLLEWDIVTPQIISSLGVLTPSRISDEPAAEEHIPFIYLAGIEEYGLEEELMIGDKNGYHDDIIDELMVTENESATEITRMVMSGEPVIRKSKVAKAIYYGEPKTRDAVGRTVTDIYGAVGRVGYNILKESLVQGLVMSLIKELQSVGARAGGYEISQMTKEVKDGLRNVPPITVASFYRGAATRRKDVDRASELLLERRLIKTSSYLVYNNKAIPAGSSFSSVASVDIVNKPTPLSQPKVEPRIRPSKTWGSELSRLTSRIDPKDPSLASRMASESIDF